MRRWVCLLAIVLPFLSIAVLAQEKRIKRSQLPKAVENAVQEQSKGATIRGFTSEVEHGKKEYEVEMTVDGHSKDVLMDGNGNVLEIEEEVAFSSLSPQVQAGIRAAAGKGKIGMVEALSKGGKVVMYEGHITKAGKHSEVHIGVDGKPAKEED